MTETTGICYAHLIGEGVVVDNGTISILLQATGPSEGARLSEFECRVDSNRNSDYFSCKHQTHPSAHTHTYRVYANRTQAKKIITILILARFSGT